MEISLENLYVEIGAERVKYKCNHSQAFLQWLLKGRRQRAIVERLNLKRGVQKSWPLVQIRLHV